MPFVVCPECENEHEEETFEGFCEACGEEFEAAAAASGAGGRTGSGSESEDDGNISYKNIVVGVIVSAEPVPKKAKLTKLSVDVGGDEEVQVVTNAKHMDEGRRVVVALAGAKVGGVTVKKSAISGIKSEGIICDGPMLGWKATKGIAVHVPDSFDPGDTPPRTKPKE